MQTTISLARAASIPSAAIAFALLVFGACAGPAPVAPPPPTTVVTMETIAEPPVKDRSGAAQPQVLTFPKEPFRAEQPEAAKPRPFQLPGIKHFTLPQKIDVYLVERHTLPTISMNLVFDGGSVNDPVGKEGMAAVCMSMMSEGTKTLDKLAFEEAQADIASEVSTWANTDEQGVSLSTLTRHLDRTLDLWVEMLLAPGFRQEDLDRMIPRLLEALKQSKATVASAAQRVRGVVTHGPKHAVGRLVTEASYGKLTTDDCVKYHARWLKPAGARLFVVGDVDEAGIRAAFGKRLAAFKGAPPVSKALGRPAGLPGRIFFVPIPGSAQSSVRMVHLGPQRNARDFVPTHILKQVLGGGFSSRINMNLREDKGWAYGARGGFAYDKQGSVFYAAASVQTDHTTDSVLELQKEIVDMKSNTRPATEDELSREKQGAILGLPSEFATAQQILSMYAELIRYGLALDYWNGFVPRIEAVTGADVGRAAAKHLQPDRLVAVVVGDPEKVLPGLLRLTAEQKLGKGDLVVMDADAQIKERIDKVAAGKRVAEAPAQPAAAPAPSPAAAPAPAPAN